VKNAFLISLTNKWNLNIDYQTFFQGAMKVFNSIPQFFFYIVAIFTISCSVPNTHDVAQEKDTSFNTNHKEEWGDDSRRKNITVDSSITLDYLMGKFEPKKDERFTVVSTKHADRSGLYLRKETYAAFLEMTAAAKKDGIKLIIKSATRNFIYQKGIWERKWSGKTKINGKNINDITREVADKSSIILQYSSMPGSSRHHWGTDFDLNAFTNSYFEKGQGLKEYEWLVTNAGKFGFCQPYSPLGKDRPKGYQEEKWHWSYLPLSTTLTEQAGLRITDEMIQGFEGDYTAQAINIVDNYILGIHPECLH